ESRLGRRGARQLRESLLEGISIDQPIAYGQNDFFELGHASFGRLDVDGFDVQETALERKSDDASAQHVRALLVPKSKILGDILVLIDARLNLHRPIHQLLFR